jgi:SAM-dependent methyltransferase
MLADLVDIKRGDQVLDFGCGRGASLEPMLEKVGDAGNVFGFDRIGQSLAHARAANAIAVDAGRLELVEGDVMAPPFPDDFFDVIICQNVVECVSDRAGLVAQARRILKPGGRLLLGHHDFDGIIVASDDRELTRRLVHGFADHQQDWQEASEGRMGRMIPGLVRSGFSEVEIETSMYVDLDLGDRSYARDYLGWLRELAPTIGVPSSDVAHWIADLEAASAEGRFFFGLPWIGAICRKA